MAWEIGDSDIGAEGGADKPEDPVADPSVSDAYEASLELAAGSSVKDSQPGLTLVDTDADRESGEFGTDGEYDRPTYETLVYDQQPEISAEEVKKRFRQNVQDMRLLEDFGTGEVIGVASWPDGAWSWQVTKLETPADSLLRGIEIDLITDLLMPVTKGLAVPPTGIDDAVTIATAISPRIVFLEICNVAVQGVACHLGLALIAPALGTLTVQVLNPLIESTGALSEAERCLQVLDVTVDIKDGKLTPNVYDFAAAQLDALLMRKMRGISQEDLKKIKALIGQQ